MHVNDRSVGEGVGSDIIEGHPLKALLWLANSEVGARMGGLPPGWVVSLGSVTQTHWLEEGETDIRLTFWDPKKTAAKHELLVEIE